MQQLIIAQGLPNEGQNRDLPHPSNSRPPGLIGGGRSYAVDRKEFFRIMEIDPKDVSPNSNAP